MFCSAQIYFFNELLPPEGDFSAQIYICLELLPPEGDFSVKNCFFAQSINFIFWALQTCAQNQI